MGGRIIRIIVCVSLCFSLAILVVPPSAKPATASPMGILSITTGPPTWLKDPDSRSIDLQPGDEIVQFTRANAVAGTNPSGQLLTVGRTVHTVYGDLSGSLFSDYNLVYANWDGQSENIGYAIEKFTFDDGAGNTFSGTYLADLTSGNGPGPYPTATGYMLVTSGTGTFSNQIMMGFITADSEGMSRRN